MSFNDVEQGLGSTNESTLDVDEDIRQYRQLTQRIAQQIFHINGSITNIERLVGFLGGSKDTQEIRNNLHDVTEATSDLIKTTTQDLKKLTAYNQDTRVILNSKQIRQRKLEQEKLTKDFKNVAANLQSMQKKSIEKQKKTIHVKDNSQPLEDMQNQRTQEQRTVISNEQMDYNELLISEREAEIENIEHGVIELNEIFRDMSFVVNEQESGIQSIYSNVFNIAQNTKHASDELVVANRHQKNARRSACWFLTIIVIVGFILALILVLA